MPTPTYTPLANLTLSGTATSVTFSSISQSYRDLRLVVTFTAGATDNLSLRFNGDTGTNYYVVTMMNYNNTSYSNAFSNINSLELSNSGYVSGEAIMCVADILDYSATNKHKPTLSRFDDAARTTQAVTGRWFSTAAITTVLIRGTSGTSFPAGSTFALFGIASA